MEVGARHIPEGPAAMGLEAAAGMGARTLVELVRRLAPCDGIV